MMEDKYISHLFDAARNEPAALSFDEVRAKFEATLEEGTSADKGNWSDFLFNLNSLVLLLLGAAMIWILLWQKSASVGEETQPVSERIAEVGKIAAPIPPETEAEVKAIVPDARSAKEISAPVVDQESKDLPSRRAIISDETPEPEPENLSLEIDSSNHERVDTTLFRTAPLPSLTISEDGIAPLSGTRSDHTELPGSTRLTLSDTARLATTDTRPANITQSVGLVLLPSDRQEAVLGFVSTLESYGLEMSFSSTTLEKKGILQQFVMKFKHPQGMDFKLKSTGFSRFEIKLQVDAKGELQGFKYRFNEEKYTDHVPLICRGHKRHMYGNGHKVIGGTTNVPIGY